MTARLTLAYDGTDFAGWARQPGLRTVQGEVERALAILGMDEPVVVAGRTDRGVHAEAQVVSHPGAPLSRRSLDALTPRDVVVLASEPALDGFDARGDARSRTYRYRIRTTPVAWPFDRRYALHVTRRLDLDALDACAAAVVGRHDLTAFTPTQTDHVHFAREILDARWERVEEGVELWITAESFLRTMIRILVGTMLQVARGARGLEDFGALLDGAPRSAAGPTAAPHGLTLMSVAY